MVPGGQSSLGIRLGVYAEMPGRGQDTAKARAQPVEGRQDEQQDWKVSHDKNIKGQVLGGMSERKASKSKRRRASDEPPAGGRAKGRL